MKRRLIASRSRTMLLVRDLGLWASAFFSAETAEVPGFEGVGMKRVKYGKYALIVSVLVLSAPVAPCQEGIMVLNHQALGFHERPLVTFKHEQHAVKIECVKCHHDYDEYFNVRGDEANAQPCANCHSPALKSRTPTLIDAFHAQCKQCHAKMRARARIGGPVMCGDCHVRG